MKGLLDGMVLCADVESAIMEAEALGSCCRVGGLVAYSLRVLHNSHLFDALNALELRAWGAVDCFAIVDYSRRL